MTGFNFTETPVQFTESIINKLNSEGYYIDHVTSDNEIVRYAIGAIKGISHEWSVNSTVQAIKNTIDTAENNNFYELEVKGSVAANEDGSDPIDAFTIIFSLN